MSTINQDHDVWFLRYKVQRTVFLSFWAIFCPLTLLTTQKIKIYMEISSFYTCVPKTTTLWGAVPEIRSETKNFCHSGSFFAILTPPPPPNNNKNQNFENKKHNQMMYAYSDMECDRHIFCHFKPFFALFTWLLTMTIKSWKKCKKRLEILTFYTCAP